MECVIGCSPTGIRIYSNDISGGEQPRMATSKNAKKSSGGRGSKEAIEKRRAARQLNTLLTGGARDPDRVDGRTEKRRKRLVKELKDGRRGRPLKPIDFVSNVHELMDLGETPSSLKKLGVKPRKTEQTPEVTEVAVQTQEAYGFRPEAWKLLGINLPSSSSEKPKSSGGRTKRKGSRKKK